MISTSQISPPSDRLMSLDMLRGFDMCWILGADAVVRALGAMTGNPVVRALAGQIEHKAWAGFAFYDLIFRFSSSSVACRWSLRCRRHSRDGGRARTINAFCCAR